MSLFPLKADGNDFRTTNNSSNIKKRNSIEPTYICMLLNYMTAFPVHALYFLLPFSIDTDRKSHSSALPINVGDETYPIREFNLITAFPANFDTHLTAGMIEKKSLIFRCVH